MEAYFASEDGSFTNILHPKIECVDNKFNIQIADNHLCIEDDEPEFESPIDDPLYRK